MDTQTILHLLALVQEKFQRSIPVIGIHSEGNSIMLHVMNDIMSELEKVELSTTYERFLGDTTQYPFEKRITLGADSALIILCLLESI